MKLYYYGIEFHVTKWDRAGGGGAVARDGGLCGNNSRAGKMKGCQRNAKPEQETEAAIRV